jgi:signal transduction histidine kinase
MSFRRRMVLLAAVAVAAAIVIASIVVYIVTRNELRGQLDASLRAKITPGRQFVKIESHLSQHELTRLAREGKLPAVLATVPGGFGPLANANGAFPALPVGAGATAPAPGSSGSAQGGVVAFEGAGPAKEGGGRARKATPKREGAGEVPQETVTIERHITRGGPKGPIAAGPLQLGLQGPAVAGTTGYVQLDLANGEVLGSTSRASHLAITPATRAVASGRRNAFFADVNVHGTRVRVLTARAAQGAAWQVALPLGDLNSTLEHLRLVLLVVVLGGIALAAALGLLVSRAALVPVRRLTGAAERVALTQDLGERIDPAGGDELGRPSASFNTMLAALQRSRLAQRQLVSDASHELRTPLAAVRAYAELFERGADRRPDDLARAMAGISRESERMSALVESLLLLARIDEGRPLVQEPVRLDQLAGEAVETSRTVDPSHPIELETTPVTVVGDSAALRQVLDNLLGNVRSHTPPETLAHVRVQQQNGDAILEISDDGPGMTREQADRAFERFYRADPSRSRDSGGAGLGLAIVSAVAEAHGGALVLTTAEGEGATFRLTLPLS